MTMYILTFQFTKFTNDRNVVLAFIKNEIVMNIEKMNIPPKPYKCSVRRPVRSIKGIEARVIKTYDTQLCILNNFTEIKNFTIMAPIPIVANLALSSVKPALVNNDVE